MLTLFNILKEFAEIQYKQGIKISFWINEQFPLRYLNMALESLTNIRFSFITSLYRIEKNNLKTCKSLYINRKLSDALNKVSHNKLIKEIIRQRKTEKTRR